MSITQTLAGIVRARFLSRRSFVISDKVPDWFTGQDRLAAMERNERWYENGGVLSEALDCYGLYAVANGITINAEGDKTKDAIQAMHDEADVELLARGSVVSTLVYGDDYYEIGGTAREPAFYHMHPSTIEHIIEGGELVGYRQKTGKSVITFKPEEVLHFQFIPSTKSTYGISLLSRAKDEIMRDVKTAESTEKCIGRHGFPKWLVNVGQSGERVGRDVLEEIGKQFEDLKHDNEIVQVADVKVAAIDTGGLPSVSEYNAISIQRLCAALGVPEEMLGLGRGSTEATANVRLQVFYSKIGAFQHIWAREYNRKVMRPRFNASITLNDVSPVDEELRSRVVKQVTSISTLDPFAIVSPEWCRNYMRVDDPDWEAPIRAEEDHVEGQ